MSGSFTLTMLGTDTLFTPQLKTKEKPAGKEYPRGETLSVISTQIKTQNAPVTDKDSVSPYIADEIQVIIGPATRGGEVGDRIGRGLAASMKAIARGQTTINLIAHSRGAVESILIAHEMNAIKKLIINCDNLDALIHMLEEQQKARIKAKISNTSDIIAPLLNQFKDLKNEERTLFFQNFKQNIAEVRLNIFGIDPVPGDLFPITWYDSRFYSIPPIVKNTEIMYYENERTNWGFTPIYTEAEEPDSQKVTLLSIPGHHGTGSAGNNLSQSGQYVLPQGTKATHVQKLLVFKIMKFLQSHGVEFKDQLEIFENGRGLGGKKLPNNELRFPKIFQRIYKKITDHKPAYEAFNRTNYSYLGLLVDDRRILKKGNYEKFRSVFQATHGYINEEHGLLMQQHFADKLGLQSFDNTQIDLVVANAHDLLKKHIDAVINPQESINDSVTSSPQLANNKVRQDILDAFSGLISLISEKYLTCDWSIGIKQAEKAKLYMAILDFLKNLSHLSRMDNEIVQDFSNKLLNQIFAGIHKTLMEQFMDINHELSAFIRTPNEQFSHFYDHIVSQMHPQEKIVLFTPEEFQSIDSLSIEKKIESLSDKLKKYVSKDQLEYFSLDKLLKIHEEQFNYKLKDFEPVYHRLNVLIADLEALAIVPDLPAEQRLFFVDNAYSLRKQVAVLIDCAAKQCNFSQPMQIPVMDSFEDLVQRQAIKLYGASHPIIQLRLEKVALQDEIIAAKEENAILKQELEKTYKDVVEGNEHRVKDENTIKRLKQEVADLEDVKSRNAAQIKLQDDNLNESFKLLNDSSEGRHLEVIFNLQKISNQYLEHLGGHGDKADKIQLLLNTLHVQPNSKPSERVGAFFTLLNEYEKALGEHRSPAWQRYVMNALTVAGVLISGILPGLVFLGLYTIMSNKSFMFWKSHGEHAVNELKECREDLVGLGEGFI